MNYINNDILISNLKYQIATLEHQTDYYSFSGPILNLDKINKLLDKIDFRDTPPKFKVVPPDEVKYFPVHNDKKKYLICASMYWHSLYIDGEIIFIYGILEGPEKNVRCYLEDDGNIIFDEEVNIDDNRLIECINEIIDLYIERTSIV